MELLLITRAIYPLHGYGGLERHCHDWTFAMSEAGCTVHVVTTPPLYAEQLNEFPSNVKFYFLSGKPSRSIPQRVIAYPQWVERIERYVEKLLDDVPIQAIYAQGLTAAACTNMKTAVIYNPHGMEEFKTSGLKFLAYTAFRNLSRQAATAATRIVATDASLISEIMTYLRVPKEKIVLIPNAVMPATIPTPEIISLLEARFHLQNKDPIFLGVGRLEKNKGFNILLHALSLTRNLPSNWKLVLAGSGKESDRLKRQAMRLRLEDHIIFSGHLSEKELQAVYEMGNIFVNPSLYEGSSLVTLEAMRHRLPIIGTRTGGIPDKVDPTLNGWLVPPNDPEALAKAIEDAVKHRDRWKEMGEASARIVNDRFSWEKVGRQFLALFENPSYF